MEKPLLETVILMFIWVEMIWKPQEVLQKDVIFH